MARSVALPVAPQSNSNPSNAESYIPLSVSGQIIEPLSSGQPVFLVNNLTVHAGAAFSSAGSASKLVFNFPSPGNAHASGQPAASPSRKRKRGLSPGPCPGSDHELVDIDPFDLDRGDPLMPKWVWRKRARTDSTARKPPPAPKKRAPHFGNWLETLPHVDAKATAIYEAKRDATAKGSDEAVRNSMLYLKHAYHSKLLAFPFVLIC